MIYAINEMAEIEADMPVSEADRREHEKRMNAARQRRYRQRAAAALRNTKAAEASVRNAATVQPSDASLFQPHPAPETTLAALFGLWVKASAAERAAFLTLINAATEAKLPELRNDPPSPTTALDRLSAAAVSIAPRSPILPASWKPRCRRRSPCASPPLHEQISRAAMTLKASDARHPRLSRLSPARAVEALRRHRAGDPVEAVAAALGVDPAALQALIEGRPAHTGVHNPRAKLDATKALRIVTLWEAGLEQKQIAAHMGISQGLVSHVVTGRAWGWITGLSPETARRRRRLPDETVHAILAAAP